jgi:hypothetical protein
MSFRSNKRKRKKSPFSQSDTTIEERFFLDAASKLDCSQPIDVPCGPVFYPSLDDMNGNPIDYIERIRPVAEKYGIAKIVPPNGWNPPRGECFLLFTNDSYCRLPIFHTGCWQLLNGASMDSWFIFL